MQKNKQPKKEMTLLELREKVNQLKDGEMLVVQWEAEDGETI